MASPHNPRTVAMVSLTIGDPADPEGVVTAFTWFIGTGTTGGAFADAMTERYGEPVASMQPADYLGTEEGLIILHEDATGFLGEPGGDETAASDA